MDDKIRKIMEMNKSGKISDDQTAKLLSALTTENEKSSGRIGPGTATPDELHREAYQTTTTQPGLHGVLRDALQGLKSVPTVISDLLSNHGAGQQSGTFEAETYVGAEGSDSTTKGNSMYSSDVGDITLTRGEFANNTFSATRFHGMELVDGRMAHCSIKGAAISKISLQDAQLEKSSFTGAHVSGLTVQRTQVIHCSFNGSRIDDWQVEDSDLNDCSFNSANLAQVEISKGCKLRDLSMNGIDGQNVLFRQSTFRHVNFNNVDLDNSQFDEAVFEHVSFSGHNQSQTLFRRVTLKDVKFRLREGIGNLRKLTMEDMKISNCNFYNCDLEGCVMRGFTMEDIDCENVDFMDRTIESLDDFLAVIQESKAK
jgi:uncharacterized protein YjbI with pentapeptide repeats